MLEWNWRISLMRFEEKRSTCTTFCVTHRFTRLVHFSFRGLMSSLYFWITAFQVHANDPGAQTQATPALVLGTRVEPVTSASACLGISVSRLHMLCFNFFMSIFLAVLAYWISILFTWKRYVTSKTKQKKETFTIGSLKKRLEMK